MDYKEQVKRIVNYIKSGEVKKEDFALGVEFEHFIIDRESLNSLHYFSCNSVSNILNDINEVLCADSIVENGYTLGFKTKDCVVSTEPGSQFEISINFKKSIYDLFLQYINLLEKIIPYFDKNGLALLALGYHPKTKIDDIKILPKKRYDFMFNYFKDKGTMAHNMMKGSAATQVIIDFSDEEDFKKKFFLGNVLSPILYTIFDNSPIFESKHYENHNLRSKIWENTDSDRSGLLKIAFDNSLSYGKYAEFILNTNPIFIDKGNEDLKSTNGKTFKELFNPYTDSDDFIFHALSIVFPDLRVKKYLEFRMMDSSAFPFNFAAISLIKGLFYSEENLNQLYNELKGTSYEEVVKCKEESYIYGLNAKFKGYSICEYGLKLINLSRKSLCQYDAMFLDCLEGLLRENKNPKDLFLDIEKSKGFKKAVEYNYIKLLSPYNKNI